MKTSFQKFVEDVIDLVDNYNELRWPRHDDNVSLKEECDFSDFKESLETLTADFLDRF